MRLSKPRIPPLAIAETDAATQALLSSLAEGGKVLNVFATFSQHITLFRSFLVWGTHIFRGSELSARDRELLILRIAWLTQSEYEWGQHVVLAKRAGISDQELARIKQGSTAAGWSPLDELLMRSTDELRNDSFISDETWLALQEHYSQRQLMDLVFTVGTYQLVAMALNTFGVQLDDGVPGF